MSSDFKTYVQVVCRYWSGNKLIYLKESTVRVNSTVLAADKEMQQVLNVAWAGNVVFYLFIPHYIIVEIIRI